MTPLDPSAIERVTGHEPQWRQEERREALALVEKLGMPSPVEEMWRYIELGFDLDDYGLVEAPGEPGDASLDGLVPAGRVVLVDGAAVSSEPVDSGGVSFGTLAAALAERPDEVQALQGRGVAADTDIFAAAHRAFGTDGAFLAVARGVTAPPVLVEIHAATAGAISFPRVAVVTEAAAHASIVIHATSPDGVDAVVVPQLEIVAGPASRVDVTLIQNHGKATRSIAHGRAVVDRDATVTLAEAGLGAALSRLHLSVDLEGQGSNTELVGAYFGDHDQVLDYRYFMHHVGPRTASNMFLKGAVEDTALSVFTGLIRIEETGQGTDAYQTNRNLILSEGAAAQSVPNLEILANDVRCGHGSTVGPLDEEQRYYLMSRGLDAERADRLQVRGFFEEALQRFPHPQVLDPLRRWMRAKFEAAQEEGRV